MMLSSATDIGHTPFLNVRRLLVISVDGQGTQDTAVARRKAVGGIFLLLGPVTGNQIESYNFGTLIVLSEQLRELRDAIIKARCAQGPVFEGTRCDDVQATLVHISLAGAPPGPETDKLLAIPTGLTIAKDDVDLLVAAGRN